MVRGTCSLKKLIVDNSVDVDFAIGRVNFGVDVALLVASIRHFASIPNVDSRPTKKSQLLLLILLKLELLLELLFVLSCGSPAEIGFCVCIKRAKPSLPLIAELLSSSISETPLFDDVRFCCTTCNVQAVAFAIFSMTEKSPPNFDSLLEFAELFSGGIEKTCSCADLLVKLISLVGNASCHTLSNN